MNVTTPISEQQQQSRAFWLRHLHQWHWISSAICLIAMLVFSATGFTLNHAADIEAHPKVSQIKLQLPEALISVLQQSKDSETELPIELRNWLEQQAKINVAARTPEWSPEEVYVPLPRPGGDAWLRIDRQTGELEYEKTERGVVSYLNDLHKGRNTGKAWSWFIDIFALACLIFCITGLFLLKFHAKNRPTTWPMVALGLLLPLLISIVFIH
jgi:hypothetical protein